MEVISPSSASGRRVSFQDVAPQKSRGQAVQTCTAATCNITYLSDSTERENLIEFDTAINLTISFEELRKNQVTRAAASCSAKRARSASSAAWESKFINPWAKSINSGSPYGYALSMPEILWISAVILPWHTRKATSKALICTMTRSLILARNWLWSWVASQRTRDNLLEYTVSSLNTSFLPISLWT